VEGLPVEGLPVEGLPVDRRSSCHAPGRIRNFPIPTVHFVADGTCKVTKFIFIGNGHDPPPGFTQRTFPPSATIDYHFSGGTIPEAGYYFTYVNDDPNDGNGGGVVKN
jgi:hypothetical protein